MKVEVPLGDVVDKITILRIKQVRLTGPGASHASAELGVLLSAWSDSGHPDVDTLFETASLAGINEDLWEVEDALRAHEQRQEFGDDFVALARRVYQLNDQRAALKRSLNEQLGSRLVEAKSYGSEDAGTS